ncbi:MAG: hypothetical protein GKR87_02200 [Kiritimatiellae bacterium]|nr:hypothetical protein [Kiritimatiellia bacterium]
MTRIPCAFSCDKEFLAIIDERTNVLGMNRSQYIIQVLRNDIFDGQLTLKVVAEKKAKYRPDKKRGKSK